MTRRTLLPTIGRVLIFLTVVSILPADLLGPTTPGHAAEARTVELGVEGMTCASCTFAVKAALKKIDGVEAAEVSYRDKKAVITYDPERVEPEALAEAVAKTGFRAVLPPAGGK